MRFRKVKYLEGIKIEFGFNGPDNRFEKFADFTEKDLKDVVDWTKAQDGYGKEWGKTIKLFEEALASTDIITFGEDSSDVTTTYPEIPDFL